MEYNNILLALQTVWTFVSLVISINIDLRASQTIEQNSKRVAVTMDNMKSDRSTVAVL